MSPILKDQATLLKMYVWTEVADQIPKHIENTECCRQCDRVPVVG